MAMWRIMTGLAVLVVGGCMSFSAYHLDAFNETDSVVRKARVTFDNGKAFEWGSMDPNIEKGMWPMEGSLGRRATVEWEDADRRPHVQKVELPGGMWNSIKFVINKDGSVAVVTQQE